MIMPSEAFMNNYYNRGGFNQPARIGYMMKMIRTLRPLTQEEWQIWYLENVHDEAYLNDLAQEMCEYIPSQYNISAEQCKAYIYDVMFRRTFNGFNKENQALRILRDVISPDVQEAPEDWDTLYFIDFYVRSHSGQLIGIQLKPDTFYMGHYQYKVDIQGKMTAFRRDFNAAAYVLKYTAYSDTNEIVFSNPEIIDEIRTLL